MKRSKEHNDGGRQDVITGRIGDETIATAAILYHGVIHTLPRPARHHDVMRKIWDSFGTNRVEINPETDIIPSNSQGFVTSRGRFVDRREALRIVKAVGQQQIDHPALNVGGQLYSEDLW